MCTCNDNRSKREERRMVIIMKRGTVVKAILISSGCCLWIIFAVLAFLMLRQDTSLRYWRVLHSGKRPCDYEPSKWVSESPDISFTISEELLESDSDITGEIRLGEEILLTEVVFDNEEGITFYEYQDDYSEEADKTLVSGTCIFLPDKLYVSVGYEKGILFRGKILEFNKID